MALRTRERARWRRSKVEQFQRCCVTDYVDDWVALALPVIHLCATGWASDSREVQIETARAEPVAHKIVAVMYP